MRLLRPRGGQNWELDRAMTPMVDVVFQLLVFFVLASGGRVAEQCLPTTLAAGSVSSAEARPPDTWITELWIHLRRDTANRRTLIELNGRRYADFPVLRGALGELADVAPESPVILDVAGDIPWGDVIELDDTCRAARFRSVNFAATPDEMRSASTTGPAPTTGPTPARTADGGNASDGRAANLGRR